VALHAGEDPADAVEKSATSAVTWRSRLASGGSIAAWLCERVGSSARVTATELETKFVSALDYSNLGVRREKARFTCISSSGRCTCTFRPTSAR
jgi:hypothetical protein